MANNYYASITLQCHNDYNFIYIASYCIKIGRLNVLRGANDGTTISLSTLATLLNIGKGVGEDL